MASTATSVFFFPLPSRRSNISFVDDVEIAAMAAEHCRLNLPFRKLEQRVEDGTEDTSPKRKSASRTRK